MLHITKAGMRIANSIAMQCLWPSTIHGFVDLPLMRKLIRGTPFAKVLASILLLTILSGVLAWSSAVEPLRVDPDRTPLSEAEQTLRRVPEHVSEFTPMSAPLAVARCGNVRPPEALLTPDPLLPVEDQDLLVRVSFIVGADGHVHSAFVLSSENPDEDTAVLGAVRLWRYRPALCNGVPTDSEARVRFSVR